MKTGAADSNLESSPSASGKADVFLMSILLLAVVVFVFRDFVFFRNAYLFKDMAGDSINDTYPHFVQLVDSFKSDGLPRWSFHQGMGQNIFALGAGDVFNPVFYLFGRDAVGFAMAYVEGLKIVISGLFFFLFLRRLDLTRYASFTGGLLYAFSAYVIVGGNWYFFSYDAMCGAILLFAFESLFTKNIWWILPIPMALLGAFEPFDLYLYGLLLFFYATVRFLEVRAWDLRGYALLMFKTVGLSLFGALLSGVFLFENIAQILLSPRVLGGFSSFRTLASQSIFQIASLRELESTVLRLFSSDLQGTGGNYHGWDSYLESPLAYCGLIALLAAPQFLLSLDGKKRIPYFALTLVCIVAIVFPFVRFAFWGFAGNYHRTFSFFISLVILYFGVRGLSVIDRTSAIRPVALMVSLGTALLLLYTLSFVRSNAVNYQLRNVIAVFLAAYGVLMALLARPRYRRLARGVALGLVCIEVAYLSNITINHRPLVSASELSQRVAFNDYTVDAVRLIGDQDSGFFRVSKDYSSIPSPTDASLNDAIVQQFYGTASYSSFNQYYYVRFLRGMGIDGLKRALHAPGLRTRPILETLASVKYRFTKDAADDANPPGYDPVITAGNVQVFRNEAFLPLGFSYDEFVLSSDFAKLTTDAKDRVLTRAFVIDDSERDRYAGLICLGPVSLSSENPSTEVARNIAHLQSSAMRMSEHHENLIRGTIDLDAKKLVYFSIPYDKGWSAKVDGRETEIHIVDFGMMGLLLEKGEHSIEWTFHLPYFTAGAVVSSTSMLAYAFFLFVPYRRFTEKLRGRGSNLR